MTVESWANARIDGWGDSGELEALRSQVDTMRGVIARMLQHMATKELANVGELYEILDVYNEGASNVSARFYVQERDDLRPMTSEEMRNGV